MGGMGTLGMGGMGTLGMGGMGTLGMEGMDILVENRAYGWEMGILNGNIRWEDTRG
jgi:hypothetical protein